MSGKKTKTKTAPAPPPKRGIVGWVLAKPGLASALSGVLVAMSFAGLGLFPLAFVATAGLLGAVSEAPSAKSAAKSAFWYGFALSLLNHHWMLFVRMPAPVGYFFAAGIIGGFFALWAWLSRGPGLGHPLAMISAYLLLEHLVNMGPFSFGWYTLGYSQWNDPLLLPAARVIGGHGLSLMLLLINWGLWRCLKDRQTWPLKTAAATAAAVSMLGFVWPMLTISQKPDRPTGKFSIILVQTNVSDEEKEHPNQTSEIVARHLRLAASHDPKPGDLVVFPETFVGAYLEDLEEYRPEWQSLKNFAKEKQVFLAFGLNDLEQIKGKDIDRNTFVVMTPDGEIEARYNKRNLVPFGEYVPYRFLLDKIPSVGQWVADNIFPLDNTPGDGPVIFKGPQGVKFASPICFETSFPWMFREVAMDGADLVLTPTNDAWFGHSFLAVQHMAQGVMRSVESGMPVIQASNSGISYATSPLGKIMWRTGVMEQTSLKQEVALTGQNEPVRTPFLYLGTILEPLAMLFFPCSLLLIRRKTHRIQA